MFIIVDPPLSYAPRWETIASVCTYEPSSAFVQYLRAARSRANRETGALEMITINSVSTVVTAVYDPDSKKVIAQIESMMQDGCVPPVHHILAHAKPINQNHHG